MEGERLVNAIHRVDVEGNRRGRPRRWINIQEAKKCVKDKRERRHIVGGQRI